MKQLTIISLFLFLSLVITVSSVSAHSGCCSWHGGVRADGCGCNDGTPLSSTCAPYYTCNAPQQNTAPANASSENTNTYIPAYVASTDTPTPIPTDTPTPTMIPTVTLEPTVTPANKISPTVMPTATVLGTESKKDVSVVGIFLLLLAPVIIIGSLWWGRKISNT